MKEKALRKKKKIYTKIDVIICIYTDGPNFFRLFIADWVPKKSKKNDPWSCRYGNKSSNMNRVQSALAFESSLVRDHYIGSLGFDNRDSSFIYQNWKKRWSESLVVDIKVLMIHFMKVEVLVQRSEL